MLYLILIFSNLISHASSTLPPLHCPSKVQSYFKEWKATEQWQEEKVRGPETSFYASPTSQFGEWVLAQKLPKGTALSRVQSAGRIEVFLDHKSCRPKTKFYPHPKKEGVTDVEIGEFIEKNQTGVIYVWSPRMGLSQKGIQEIKKAAAEEKLPLMILLDKDTSSKERATLEKELGKDSVQLANSFELNMRHVQMHFPALLVFKDKKIQPGVKYGYEKANRYKLDLRKLLQ